MQQGMHRRMLSLGQTLQRYWVDTVRGSFKFKEDKYEHMKPIHCIAHKDLVPDLLAGLQAFRKLDKLT